MRRIQTTVDPKAPAFRDNAARMQAVVADFKALQERVRHERPQRDIERLRRQNKLMARERLDLLLDPGTPFLELSSIAAYDQFNGEAPGANVISGIGVVNGREVMIHADDSSNKGGAWYPLSAPKIVRALYQAGQAGVEIDLIVRGICCLRPGVPGLSETIRVRSIVGRFLEHSRIFWFHANGKELVYCSSADWMGRNFFRRIEAAFPVASEPLKQHLTEALRTYLRDNTQAWELETDGSYTRCRPQDQEPCSAQRQLLGLEDDGHAAAANFAVKPVASELGAGRDQGNICWEDDQNGRRNGGREIVPDRAGRARNPSASAP